MSRPGPDDAPPRRRADAQRNLDRILTTARDAFAEPDVDVSMAEIARRAGIGSATLYRNFPDRRSLLAALYGEEITAICRAAQTGEGPDALTRLRDWLVHFYDYFTNKRVLANELLAQPDGAVAVFDSGYARVIAAATPLVEAAHAAGELRQELSLEQILALVTSIANIDGDDAYRRPILAAALDALDASRTPGR